MLQSCATANTAVSAGGGNRRQYCTRGDDLQAISVAVCKASTNPRSVPRSSPQSSCTGAWHPRKDDTHKSVRTWLKGQETKRIECYGCEFLGV